MMYRTGDRERGLTKGKRHRWSDAVKHLTVRTSRRPTLEIGQDRIRANLRGQEGREISRMEVPVPKLLTGTCLEALRRRVVVTPGGTRRVLTKGMEEEIFMIKKTD